jgi:HSP20 family protein
MAMNDVAMKNGNGTVAERPERAERRVVYTPQVDVLETPEGLVLQLDMPGVKGDDVEVHFERGELSVRGRRKDAARPGRGLVEEFEPGDYYRAFLVSQDVAADRITAELKHGVLTVHLPHHEQAKPRKVAVKVS